MKIAAYTITKNEAPFIERWADSCAEADYRIVVDTGSDDETLQIARSMGCVTYNVKVSPWRFDDARNAALALVPDVDYCVALDADEVLVDGWRAYLEEFDPTITRPPLHLYTLMKAQAKKTATKKCKQFTLTMIKYLYGYRLSKLSCER